MAIQRWDPVGDVVRLRERVNRLFEEVLSRSSGTGSEAGSGNGWKPPMDLYEQPDRFVLRTDLPGVEPADLEVEVENGVLTLRGERRMDSNVPVEAYLRVERPHGRFAVQVSLPDSVETRSIQALHQGGVVEIILPKRREQRRTSRIQVEAK